MYSVEYYQEAADDSGRVYNIFSGLLKLNASLDRGMLYAHAELSFFKLRCQKDPELKKCIGDLQYGSVHNAIILGYKYDADLIPDLLQYITEAYIIRRNQLEVESKTRLNPVNND